MTMRVTPATRPRILRLRYLVPVCGLGVIVWLGFTSYRPAATALTSGERHVVERGTVEETLFVSGVVEPAVTIDVRSEVSGLVEEVHVDEGDRVMSGQELVTLDSRLAQTAVNEAEAALRQAEMQQSVARLDLDEDTVDLRRIELGRQRALQERGLASLQELEAAEHRLRQAERSFQRAEASLDSNEARIEQLRAAVERARAQMQQTTIRSRLDAWVIRRHVEVGSGVAGVSQSTSGGTVLVTLGDATRASLSSQVTAADARRIEPGMPARIRLDSDPDLAVTGTVERVSAAGDVNEQTRLTTFPVTISVASEDDAAWINIPAQAEIVVAVHSDVLLVPDRCLDTDGAGRTTVLRESNGEVASQVVEVGIVSADQVQVVSGLDAGDALRCRAGGR
jgi:RND family efflux transporter MFP subunit